jgi:hypothetical protein
LDLGVLVTISLPTATRFSVTVTVLAFRSTFAHRNPAISVNERPWREGCVDAFGVLDGVLADYPRRRALRAFGL